MKYLHTMVRVTNLDESLDFYCNKLGLKEIRRMENEKGKYTLIFLGAENSDDRYALLELTYNWEPEEYAGGSYGLRATGRRVIGRLLNALHRRRHGCCPPNTWLSSRHCGRSRQHTIG